MESSGVHPWSEHKRGKAGHLLLHLDVAWLCAGLQNNRCIKELDITGIDIQNAEQMSTLAPFLSNNPTLKEITLEDCSIGPGSINTLSTALLNRAEDTIETLDLSTNRLGDMDLDELFLALPSLKNVTLRHCNIGPGSIHILSTALLNRAEDTIETLNLSNNRLGDMDLDEFVQALSRCRTLTQLVLSQNGIGLRGCASLVKLLENQESNLVDLRLSGNSIDEESVIIFSGSLTKNTKLRLLHLEPRNGITAAGWSAILKLVCNNSSINSVMESNHTLSNLGFVSENALDLLLGVDDANLLRASLKMNNNDDKMLVARRKILWSHVRGNINIGDSPIVAGAMPRILSWIGDDSNDTNTNPILYHDPPLPKTKLDAIRLDSIYHILRSMPKDA